jgi:hypothetical protein
MTDTMIKPEALTALKNYMQADEDGVMAYVSRQALDEAIVALAATPAVSGEEIIEGIAKTIWLAEFGRAFNRVPSDPWENQAEPIKEGHRNTARKIVESGFLAAHPASPLRGRVPLCPNDMGFDNEIGPLGCRLVAQELECVCEYMHFFASPSEQPAASPYTVEKFLETIEAKNARIAELEEMLGKAVLSSDGEPK